MNNKTIIGFAGRQRSGKTSICKYLEENRGAEIVTVASALKKLVCDLLMCDLKTLNRLKDEGTPIYKAVPYTNVPRWWDTAIERVYDEVGAPDNMLPFAWYSAIKEVFRTIDKTTTVRELLQMVGTDIIRKHNPMWHVNKLVENIQNSDSDLVVVDDIRFPNEREAVEKLGGQVFFVIRPDLTIQVSQHSSETSLTWHDFDDRYVILNYSTEEFMHEKFGEIYDTEFHLTGSCPILKSYYDNVNDSNDSFGPQSITEGAEAEKIVRIVFDSIKVHNGVFLYHSANTELSNQITRHLYKRPFHINEEYHTFAVWNPMIIENFKAWL